jgi:hypothetical protein
MDTVHTSLPNLAERLAAYVKGVSGRDRGLEYTLATNYKL